MKLRKARVIYRNEEAGILEETKDGYAFTYNRDFLKKIIPISHSLPTSKDIYVSKELFPFFVGLLPEGWYLEIVSKTLKVDTSDAFGILLATCKDTIGAVSIEEID